MANAAIWNRLMEVGLREAAETVKHEIRERYKRLGDPRSDANEKAEIEMWEIMRPAVEKVEKKIQDLKDKIKQPKSPKGDDSPPTISVCTDKIEQFIDPNYSEKDPARWLRDGLLWNAAEFQRVVTDSPQGISISLALAKNPPPNAWAITCLEYFARPDKRGELIARVLPFASKRTDQTEPPEAGEAEDYLDSI